MLSDLVESPEVEAARVAVANAERVVADVDAQVEVLDAAGDVEGVQRAAREQRRARFRLHAARREWADAQVAALSARLNALMADRHPYDEALDEARARLGELTAAVADLESIVGRFSAEVMSTAMALGQAEAVAADLANQPTAAAGR